MRRSTATTLQDVAREAGVTAMTVSVVINGSRSATRVSDATRERIVEAASRLRYRPNAVARGLSRSRMDTIGVIAPLEKTSINLYFMEVLNGLLAAASASGQNTTISSVADWSDHEQKILRFCDGRADGIILIGPLITPSFASTLHHYTPFVTLHADYELPNTYNLDVDNERAEFEIVNYLISLGHRRIAHFKGIDGLSGAEQRLAGYKRALESAGIPFDSQLVLLGDFGTASGAERMRFLLERRSRIELPTAIACVNDSVADGCLAVLNEHGVKVPEEISVVGFDDLLTAKTTIPPLTTVRQPFHDMGVVAVDLLLKQIGKDGVVDTEVPVPAAESEYGQIAANSPHKVIFDHEMVIRKSAGPAPSTLNGP